MTQPPGHPAYGPVPQQPRPGPPPYQGPPQMPPPMPPHMPPQMPPQAPPHMPPPVPRQGPPQGPPPGLGYGPTGPGMGYGPLPVPQSPPPPQAVRAAGDSWLRRNRWGLILFVPVLVATFALPAREAYKEYTQRSPVSPVVADSDGWVAYNGARLRLLEVAPLINLQRGSGTESYDPGPNVRGWQAVIAVEAADPKKMLGGCEVALLDSDGRRYYDNPHELIPAQLGSFAACTPLVDDDEEMPTSYTVHMYFVMPSTETPVAVRIWHADKLPRYALLSATGT